MIKYAKSNYPEAEKLLLEAEAIYLENEKEEFHPRRFAEIYSLLSNIYYKLNDMGRSEEYEYRYSSYLEKMDPETSLFLEARHFDAREKY